MSTNRRRWFIAVFIAVACFVSHELREARGAVPARPRMRSAGSSSGGFIANRGQWEQSVRFGATFRDGAAFVTSQGLRTVTRGQGTTAVALEFDFGGPASAIDPGDPVEDETRVHFLRGADPARFAADCEVFSRVVLRDVEPGIDVVLRVVATGIEWDLKIAPRCESRRTGPVALPVRVRGHERLDEMEDGGLAIATGIGTIFDSPPQASALEEDGSVRSIGSRHVVLSNDVFCVVVDESSHARSPIVVDPVLAFATLLGGAADEPAYGGAAFDDHGGTFVVGRTHSFDFPVTLGAFDITQNGSDDIFVAKLVFNGESTKLAFATFVGGHFDDDAFGIDLAADGGVMIAGRTVSFDFPVTSGAYDTTYSGYYDVVAFELRSDGSALRWSTFLGGKLEEYAYRLRRNADGSFWIGGYTASPDFPVTHGAYQSRYAGGIHDAFVARLSSDGRELLASTLLGGTGGDYVYGLAVDANGTAYVAGYTSSVDLPITVHAFDSTFNGPIAGASFDFFVAQIDGDARHLVHSTYLGGGSHDFCFGLTRLTDGSIVVGGSSYGNGSFPSTPGAYDSTPNGGYDGVVARLSPQLDHLVFATFLGGHDDEALADISSDADDRIYGVGQSRSTDFPVTPNAAGLVNGGGYDGILSVLDPLGRTLLTSTFLGGASDDFASSIAIEGAGRAHVFGETRSTDFPTTTGAIDSTANGGADAFIVRYMVPICGGPPAAVSYGQASGGGANSPLLVAHLQGPAFSLEVVGGKPFAPAVLFFGKSQIAFPFLGGTLLVDPLAVIPLGALDGSGRIVFEGPWPEQVAQCGTLVYEQVGILEAGSGSVASYALSNGVAITLGQ